MKSRFVLSLLATVIAVTSIGCTYSPHYDHHARGTYHAERGGHYAGYERHQDHCD